MRKEDKILTRCGKGNPFQVPENYFSLFHEDLMAKIADPAYRANNSKSAKGIVPNLVEDRSEPVRRGCFSSVTFQRVPIVWKIAAVALVAVTVSAVICLQDKKKDGLGVAPYQAAVDEENEFTDEEIRNIVEGSCLDDYDLYQLISDAK